MRASVVIIVLLPLLYGCNHKDEVVSVAERNLSGTWKHTQVHRFYTLDTDVYLFSDFIESTLVITEENGVIKYSACWDYGAEGDIATKTDDQLILDFGTRTFHLNDDGSYATEEELKLQQVPLTNDSPYFNRQFTLTKISDDVIIDDGLFVLDGPVAVTEFSHVCLWRIYSDVNSNGEYELIVPFEDQNLQFRIGYASTLEAGTIDYVPFEQGAPIYRFFILSNASAFRDIVGSNLLPADSATINITESSDAVLGGTFSFDARGEAYSGEFQMLLDH